MAAPRYTPPVQSGLGQFFDSIVILVLVFAALYAPLILGLAGGGKVELKFKDAAGVEKPWAELAAADKTWATLGQNATMQAQWEKLGQTPETAAPMIAARYDYSFSWLQLLMTAIVVISYFGFLIVYSKQEYQDVIAEKFGQK
jgi:hypothetical protein